jgi:serine/threonine-protein kinase
MTGAADCLELLSSVAASISADGLIEWEAAQQVAGGDEGVLDELRLLARIARLHQSAHEDETESADVANSQLSHPRTWAHFVILGRLGSGSYGDVYRAHDTTLQSEVALKLMRDESGVPMNSSRALKEARYLARVRHPNVVTVYGADQSDGRVGLWMELVRGTTLEETVQRQGIFGPREASLVGIDLCRAVAAVHGAGLLHGDIKAHNVMREEGGRIVLMDFGMGKDLDQDIVTPHAGGSHDFAGTPIYLAPEVFAGLPRTKATDVYSLGVLLFHLVTNRYPVEGETRAAIGEAHQRGARTLLRDVRPDLPDAFVNIVERAVDPEARQRFQSVGAMEIALARFLGAAVGNRDTEPRRTHSIVLTAVAVAILIGVCAYSWTIRTSNASSTLPSIELVPVDSLRPQLQKSHTYIVNEGDMNGSSLLIPPEQISSRVNGLSMRRITFASPR